MLAPEKQAQLLDQCPSFDFSETKHLSDSGNHQAGVINRCEGNEADTVSKLIHQLHGYLQTETCLTNTPCTGKSKQAYICTSEKGTYSSHLLFTPDQRGEWHGNGRGYPGTRQGYPYHGRWRGQGTRQGYPYH